ncbi:hypothetical protein EJB05_28698, partial [Eragrostis curvula]
MDPDLEKAESPTAGVTRTASLADEDHHRRPCSCGSDGPDYSCRRHHTYGLRNDVFVRMILVSLFFALLAAILLGQNPAPATVGSNALPNTSSVVWKVSLLACAYLYFWILALSRTTGAAAAAFFRVSYGALLAFAGGALVGPQAGVAVAHLTTALAAGIAGHALAEHRVHAGFERAADEAAARTPARLSEDDRIGVSYSVFAASLVTLGLAAGVAWLAFFPTFGDEDGPFIVMVLSCLVWAGLYFWVIMVCFAVSPWLWAYYFGVEMVAMAAFFGYILGVNARRKEILAREHPAGVLEWEAGDHEEDMESASAASTGEDAGTQSCHLEEHSPLIADHENCI